MMRTSEEIGSLAEALSKAQGELKNIEKGKVNPHFKSRYADIADGLEVIRPILSKHGLSVVQVTSVNHDTGMFCLITRLMHSSGQWIESSYPLPTGKAQEQGSAITYARRYSLFSLVGTAGTDEDDDGNAANTVAPAAPVTVKMKPKMSKAASDYLDALLAAGTQEAKKGTEALRKWWTTLPQEDRAALTPEQVNILKDTAAQASTEETE
jgi:hypothetical protein